MRSNRRTRGLRCSDSELVQFLGSAAGHRHFGTDDVHGRLSTHFAPRRLRDRTELRGALCEGRLGQWLRVIAARHRTIEMNLAEPRANVVVDHLRRLRQRGCGGLGAPGIRTQMIAAEPEQVHGETDARSDIVDEAPEIRGTHPGIAAELIDLIRSRLDQQRRCARPRFAQRTFDDLRMRRAQRIDADALSSLVPRHDVEESLHACTGSSDCNASTSAAASASAIPAIFSGPGATPVKASEITAVSNGAPALTSGETMMALPRRNAITSVSAPIALSA